MEIHEATTRSAWRTIPGPVRRVRSAVAALLTSAALLFVAVGCERDYVEERDRLRPRPGTVTDDGPATEADDDDRDDAEDVTDDAPRSIDERDDAR